MTNPFEEIEARLSSIENLLLDLKHLPKQVEPQEESDQLLSVKEAADFLHLTIQTVYGKKSRGELAACKAPGSKKLVFLKSDLIDYLTQGRQKTNSEIEAEANTYLKKRGAK